MTNTDQLIEVADRWLAEHPEHWQVPEVAEMSVEQRAQLTARVIARVEGRGSAARRGQRRLGGGRWVLVAATVVAVIVSVGWLGAVRRSDDGPTPPLQTVPLPPSTSTAVATKVAAPDVVDGRVTLTDGFSVPVVGHPVLDDGSVLFEAAPGPGVDDDVVRAAVGTEAPEVLLDPIDVLALPRGINSTLREPQTLVLLGEYDGFTLAIYAQTTMPAGALRCFMPTSANGEAVGACSRDTMQLGGAGGSWNAWVGVPADTAFVALLDGDQTVAFARPVGDTVVFPSSIAVGDGMVAHDSTGAVLDVRGPERFPGAAMFPIQCLSLASDAASHGLVPAQIDFASDPVTATGYAIGQTLIEGEAGRRVGTGNATRPEWTAVGAGEPAIVVGFSYGPNADPAVSPAIDAECHAEAAIYDEWGVLIGRIVDGIPEVAPQATPRG